MDVVECDASSERGSGGHATVVIGTGHLPERMDRRPRKDEIVRQVPDEAGGGQPERDKTPPPDPWPSRWHQLRCQPLEGSLGPRLAGA